MSKATALLVTEAQIAERMGLQTDELKAVLPTLTKAGFPQPDPLLKNRRYWPACQAFLDRRYGLTSSSPQADPGLDGAEQWN